MIDKDETVFIKCFFYNRRPTSLHLHGIANGTSVHGKLTLQPSPETREVEACRSSSSQDKSGRSPEYTSRSPSFDSVTPCSPQRPRSYNRSYSYEANISRSPLRNSVHSRHSSYSDTQKIFKRPIPSLNHLKYAGHSSMQSSGGRPHLHRSHSLEEPRSLTSQNFKFLTSSSPVSSIPATLHTSVGNLNPISYNRTAIRDPFSTPGNNLSTGSSSFVGRRLSSAGLSPRPLHSTRRLSILWVTNHKEI